MAAEREWTQRATGRCLAGKYELRRPLGVGAMGAVYEGVHLELGKRLAIKLIQPEFCDSPEAVGRFRREAKAASAIESEHVAQIFDFGSDATLGLYMVIEYLDGEDLEARLARDRWIEPLQAAAIGWQVARGLSRAHAVGVVHRDLKPANVFLTKRDDGSLLAKILDFGISKLDANHWPAEDGGGGSSLTERGTTLGTPQYMSPEQCQGLDGIDGRADVWSLCAVLYEMLSGEPAFAGGQGFVAVMQAIVSTDVAPLASRARWVPEGLARVVDAGLVRDRDQRIGSSTLLANRLLEAQEQLGSCSGAYTREVVIEPDATRHSRLPSSEPPPPSSGEEGVEIFLRNGEIPLPVGKRRR